MSKILRIYEEGGETSDDWGKAKKYGSDVIKKIQDPAGLTAKKAFEQILRGSEVASYGNI